MIVVEWMKSGIHDCRVQCIKAYEFQIIKVLVSLIFLNYNRLMHFYIVVLDYIGAC